MSAVLAARPCVAGRAEAGPHFDGRRAVERQADQTGTARCPVCRFPIVVRLGRRGFVFCACPPGSPCAAPLVARGGPMV